MARIASLQVAAGAGPGAAGAAARRRPGSVGCVGRDACSAGRVAGWTVIAGMGLPAGAMVRGAAIGAATGGSVPGTLSGRCGDGGLCRAGSARTRIDSAIRDSRDKSHSLTGQAASTGAPGCPGPGAAENGAASAEIRGGAMAAGVAPRGAASNGAGSPAGDSGKSYGGGGSFSVPVWPLPSRRENRRLINRPCLFPKIFSLEVLIKGNEKSCICRS